MNTEIRKATISDADTLTGSPSRTLLGLLARALIPAVFGFSVGYAMGRGIGKFISREEGDIVFDE